MKRLLLLFFISLPTFADSIAVLGLFSGKAYLSIEGDNKMLSVGESYKGVTLLEATGRFAKIETSQGVVKKITTGTQITKGYKKAKAKEVKIYPDRIGMYQVNGLINNRSISFLVDTGATNVAMSERHAEKLGLKYKNKNNRSSAQTASGVVSTWEITLDSVDIGGLKVNYVPASVISGNHPYQVLLGMSYLKHLKVQHSGGAMLLQKKY